MLVYCHCGHLMVVINGCFSTHNNNTASMYCVYFDFYIQMKYCTVHCGCVKTLHAMCALLHCERMKHMTKYTVGTSKMACAGCENLEVT